MDLDLDGDGLQRLLGAVVPHLARWLDGLEAQPARDLDDAAARARAIRHDWPEQGWPLDDALYLLFEQAVPPGLHTAGGGYLAYIPGGGLPHAGVGDLITAVVNRYVGVWAGAPALVELELQVARWLCDLAGLGPSATGLLTTGGSMANFIAVFTARRERLPERFLDGRLYTSSQAHHSVAKAAMLAGFPASSVVSVAVRDDLTLDLDALRTAIDADRTAGAHPFLVVGNAGTTNTGAIDDLHGLADLCADQALHLHLDAAYGGAFLLTERGRARLDGIGRADSITLDPHKGLFLPYGSGALLMRDADALARAHTVHAAYLTDVGVDDAAVDLCNRSPELSRESRAIRLWLPMVLAGRRAFADVLDAHLDHAAWVGAQLEALDGVELYAPTTLTVVSFHAPAYDDAFHMAWLNGVLARKRVMLSATVLGGRTVLRVAILSFRTQRAHVEAAVTDLTEVYETLVHGPRT
jgi:aromatic-L-amino-acid decarboxylase